MVDPERTDHAHIQPAATLPFPTRERPRSSLPIGLTPLIGRDDEMAGVASTVRGEQARLVTLTGWGGAG